MHGSPSSCRSFVFRSELWRSLTYLERANARLAVILWLVRFSFCALEIFGLPEPLGGLLRLARGTGFESVRMSISVSLLSKSPG